MNPLNLIDNSQGNPFTRTTEDQRSEFTLQDRVRDTAPEPNEPERDIFAIARVIAARGYRYRVLRGASSIV